jgi:hypothetical protein
MLPLLVDHSYATHGAFLRADAATLAVGKVGGKMTLDRPDDAHVRAKKPADSAFYALSHVYDRFVGTPGAGFILHGIAGFRDNRADFQFMPVYLINRFSHSVIP